MTSSEKSRAELSASADQVGQRTAGGSVNDITEEHVQILQATGVPDATIARLLREAGMEESDVAGFALDAPTTEPPGIVIQTICVGTCPRFTIEISVTSRCPKKP